MSVITLISIEGERIDVPAFEARESGLVRENEAEGNTDVTVQFTAETLKKVVDYLHYHFDKPAAEIPKPLPNNQIRDVVCEWDANFIDVDQRTVLNLVLAADAMDIPPLLELACAKVASLIRGKTREEIRKVFE